jgi:hypothetical protein
MKTQVIKETPQPKKMQYTLGSDPELCIQNRKTGKILSSIPILKHDKHDPIDLKNGIFMYSDNILAEAKFPPVSTKAEFIGVFKTAFERMKKHLGDEYTVLPLASHLYDDSELKEEEAWAIGCNANYNGYKEAMNPIVEFENGLRTGSCHIHVGSDILTDFDLRHKAIRLLDIFAGCPSVIFERSALEESKARRKYYGQAAEFRPCAYGLEYRVLSPFCMRSPQLMDLVYDLVDYSMSIIANGKEDEVLARVKAKDVQFAINECDVSMARKVLVAAELPKELLERAEAEYQIDLKDFESNWGI